jgi:hypothetical protein
MTVDHLTDPVSFRDQRARVAPAIHAPCDLEIRTLTRAFERFSTSPTAPSTYDEKIYRSLDALLSKPLTNSEIQERIGDTRSGSRDRRDG